MTAITTTQKNHLNKSNRASQDVALGTVLQNLQGLTSGSLSVTTAQMSASAVTVYNDRATLGFFMFQVTRSGSTLATIFQALRSGGSLTIVPPTTGSFLVGDKVNYLIA